MGDGQRGSTLDLRATGLFVAVAALAAYPPLALLLELGTSGAFKHFSHDVFYYLAVAENSRGAPFFSFDGVHPTNGFHPLWCLYLHGAFTLLDLDLPAQVRFTSLSSTLFTALGTACFALAALRLTNRLWLSLLACVPGFFHLVLSPFGLRFGSQWSFANGMESPLSVLFFGALSAWLFRDGRRAAALSPRGWIVLSFGLTCMTFARLDDVFAFVPFGLYAAATAQGSSERNVRLLRLGLLPAIAIGAYVLFNQAYAGSFLPSSGATKSQPLWGLLRNGYATLTTFFPFLDLIRTGPSVWYSEAWRILQMLVPAAIAGLWLWRRGVPFGPHAARLAPWSAMLGALASFVVIKAAYNFAMVGLWHQGSWYYVVSIMLTNLLIAVALAEWLERTSAAPVDGTARAQLLARALPASASLLLVWVLANAVVDRTRTGGYMRQNHTFWQERSHTRDLIAAHCPGCGVLAFEDGIVSYSLGGVPTLNGFGLASDREAVQARAEGRLLELAYERGHRLIASVNYPMSDRAYSDMDQLRRELQANPHTKREPLDRWAFEVAFETPESRVIFVRFRPREEDP